MRSRGQSKMAATIATTCIALIIIPASSSAIQHGAAAAFVVLPSATTTTTSPATAASPTVTTAAFAIPRVRRFATFSTRLDASSSSSGGGGMGFGNKKKSSSSFPTTPPAKTYIDTPLVDDVIDTAAAMQDFFDTRQDWLPLFRELLTEEQAATCPAREYLAALNDDTTTTASTSSSPLLKQLEAIPTADEHKQHLETFLDSMHQSLLDIPVTFSQNGVEDENDLHFLEEGRRMLAVNRFHVVTPTTTPTSENTAATAATTPSSSSPDNNNKNNHYYEEWFTTCWSEVFCLHAQNQVHTGSLILMPGHQLTDLQRFCDMNLLLPLQWLGIPRNVLEIASLERGSPAIRLLYKLQDMPESEQNYPGEG